MILTDTGPLVALIDEHDRFHDTCVGAVEMLSVPLVTSLACWTEAMHLLKRSAGYPGQRSLWEYRAAGALLVEEFTDPDLDRARFYWERFRDVPCDFADASILALSERFNAYSVFTLDRHFYAYQVGGKPLRITPGA